MMAVWGLTGLEKPMIPLYEPLYDIRVIAKSLEMAAGSDTLNLETLEKLKERHGRVLRATARRSPRPPARARDSDERMFVTAPFARRRDDLPKGPAVQSQGRLEEPQHCHHQRQLSGHLRYGSKANYS